LFDQPQIDQVAVALFADLKQAIPKPLGNGAHTDRNVELVVQVVLDFHGKLFCTGGHQVDGLRHPRPIDVGVDRLRAEQNDIVAAAQELKHGLMERGQRQRLARDKLPKTQCAGI
jgi:hypothetical protein